jgi:hypothetical protein
MNPFKAYFVALGAAYGFLLYRIKAKRAWQIPEYVSPEELYNTALEKGIDKEAIARGICHFAKKDGFRLSEAAVQAEVWKIVKEAKQYGCYHTGDREMVDFMSLDEQQLALLESLKEPHYPRYGLQVQEEQLKIIEDMHPQQVFELFQLLYHQTAKMHALTFGLYPQEEKWDIALNHAITESRWRKPPEEATPKLDGGSGETPSLAKGLPNEIPSVLEENIWSYIPYFDWENFHTLLSVWF